MDEGVEVDYNIIIFRYIILQKFLQYIIAYIFHVRFFLLGMDSRFLNLQTLCCGILSNSDSSLSEYGLYGSSLATSVIRSPIVSLSGKKSK